MARNSFFAEQMTDPTYAAEVAAAREALTQTHSDDEPDYDWDDWERPDSAFCDVYEVHDKHVYTALNSNTYLCPGLGAEDMAAIEAEAAQPPCEHGMSANLCAGPMHYPADH